MVGKKSNRYLDNIMENYEQIRFKKWLRIVEDNIAGNAEPKKQLHVFDFDDTLGVTQNANGVMLYQNGQPIHKTPEDVKNWVSANGLTANDLTDGPDNKKIQYVNARNGYVVYVTSGGLAKIQRNYDRSKQFVTGFGDPKGNGEEILIDFTPSSYVDKEKTHPIPPTVSKLADVKSKNANAIVMTARKTGGTGQAIEGKQVQTTNASDIKQFLAKNGVPPDDVIGVSGQNKGNEIKKYIASKYSNDFPDEIHFYDDLEKNTSEVEAALAKKTPAELHLYGPGEFEKGEATPFRPSKSYDKQNIPAR